MILGILGVIIFITGAYFIGNKILNTFDEDWIEQLISTAYGFLVWFLIAAVITACYFIYHFCYINLNNIL